MEKNFIGYLLEALEPDETLAVEAHLAEHPESMAHLERLRSAIAVLDADGTDPPPTDDLYVRTLATVAEHIVELEGRVEGPRETPVTDFIRNYARLVDGIEPEPKLNVRPAQPPVDRDSPQYRESRRNIIAAFGLTLALSALAVPAVLTFREHQQLAACQNNLMTFHQSIAGYSDDHQGRLPLISENQTAGEFVTELTRAGRLSQDTKLTCPGTGHVTVWLGGEPDPRTLEYAYSLGYRTPDRQLHGLTHDGQLPDTMPILADAPIAAVRPRIDGKDTSANHRQGQNVLFLGGNARFCTNALVGPDRDNIFCNQEWKVNAGIHSYDAVLGRANEKP